MDIELFKKLGVLLVHHVRGTDEHFVRTRLADIAHRIAAANAVGELFDRLTTLNDLADGDTVINAAVILADDNVLADIDHSAGKVTGVCGTKRRIGKTLTRTTAGNEVFKNA